MPDQDIGGGKRPPIELLNPKVHIFVIWLFSPVTIGEVYSGGTEDHLTMRQSRKFVRYSSG
jgi:hypothetical protein